MPQVNSHWIDSPSSPLHKFWNILRIWVVSLWLSLSTSQAVAETQESLNQLMYCDFWPLDLSQITTDYTVVSWDTLWKIALKNNVPIQDLLLVWNYLNPERNENSIQIWEVFSIPKSDDETLVKISLYREQIQKEQDFKKVIEYWQTDQEDKILEQFWYNIFPTQPTGLGIQDFNNSILREYTKSPRAYGPRVVDIDLQKLVICANLSRSADRYAIWLSDELPEDVMQWLLQQNMDAWMFTEWYTKIWYTQKLNAREMFTWRLSKWSNPILVSERDNYESYLVEMQEYFKTQWVVGTKIPAFFLYTNAIPSINAYKNWENPNSHVFSYMWESINDPFRADEFMPISNGRVLNTFQDGMSVLDYLSYVSQDLWGMFNSLSPASFNKIQSNLVKYAPYIEFYINWEKIDIEAEFANPSIGINTTDMIQFWWSIVFDWFHVNTSENEDLRENMNMRLLPLWSVLSLEVYFPTEILETPDSILDLAYTSNYWDILQKIEKQDVFDLREWDDIKAVILDVIAQEEFWIDSYWELTIEQSETAQEYYRLQSLAYQMYWYQTNGGAEWNASATKVNAPMYYFNTENIQQVYNEYIFRKKSDYYKSLRVNCENWELQRLPFFQIQFFPGDSSTSLLYQLQYQLHYTHPELAKKLSDFDRIQKNAFIKSIFWEEVASWNFPAWKSMLVWIEKVTVLIELLWVDIFETDFILQDENGNRTIDTDLIAASTTNPTMQYLLSYILASESYIPWFDESLWEFYRETFWMLFDNTLTSRRWLKDIFYYVQQAWYTQKINTELKKYWISEILSDAWLPTWAPTISSFWDFQFRFFNLFEKNYKDKWPGNNLSSNIETILAPESPYTKYIDTIASTNPNIVAQDLEILHQILELISGDIINWNGWKIYDLMKDLMRLDNGTHSNIIWKILSIEMMNVKMTEHFENIATQITLSGWSLENFNDDMRRRFAITAMFTNNMSEWKEILAITENYIARLILTLDEIYPNVRTKEFPEMKKWSWMLDQLEYWNGKFRENMWIYLEMLSQYPQTWDVVLANQELSKLTEFTENYTKTVLNFLDNDIFEEILRENNKDTSIIPTLPEFQWANDSYFKSLFRYVNNYESVSKRIERPELVLNDLVALWILAQVLLGMGVRAPFVLIEFWISRTIKLNKKRKKNIIKWDKKRKKIKDNRNIWNAKKVLTRAVSKVQDTEINDYLMKRNNQQIDSDYKVKSQTMKGFPLNWELLDGNYLITKSDGIKDYTSFENYEDLILTNDPKHPESFNYKDWNYQFFDPLTQIVRNAYAEILSKKVDEPKIPYILSSEFRVENKIAAE